MLSAPRYLDQPYLEMETWSEQFLMCSLGFERQPQMGFPLRLFLSYGEPADEILRFATEHACDLVVVAWGGSLRGERGKVVKALVERAPCPLLFVRCPGRVGNSLTHRHSELALRNELPQTRPRGNNPVAA